MSEITIKKSNISLKIINDDKAFYDLREKWEDLSSHVAYKSFFLNWTWMYNWWQYYSGRNKSFELMILAGEHAESGELVGLLPLYIRDARLLKIAKFREIRFIGTGIESTDYLEIISRTGYEEAVGHLFLEYLLEGKGRGDSFVFENLIESSLLLRRFRPIIAAKNISVSASLHRICPYVTLPASYDEYLSTLSANWRSNVRRKTRKLFKMNDISFEVLSDPSRLPEALPDLFNLHNERFRQVRKTSGFYQDVRLGFHQKMSGILAGQKQAILFALKDGEKRIATLYCFSYDKRLMYFQSGFDPDYQKFSVGAVLLGKVIEYAIDSGYEIFDFMRGGEDYKFHWAKSYEQIFNLQCAVSGRAKLKLKSTQTLKKLKKIIKTGIGKKELSVGNKNSISDEAASESGISS